MKKAKTQFPFKEGDRVKVKAFFGPGGKPGTMLGTVLRVTPRHSSGGNLGMVRVQWDNGYVGLNEERVLEIAEDG